MFRLNFIYENQGKSRVCGEWFCRFDSGTPLLSSNVDGLRGSRLIQSLMMETHGFALDDRVDFEREKYEESRQNRRIQNVKVVLPGPRD